MQRLVFILAVLVNWVCFLSPAQAAETIALQAGPAAPIGAKGTVEFQPAPGGPASLLLHAERLRPGLYWLFLAQKSTGETLFAGVVAVPDPTAQPDREANQSFKTVSSAHAVDVLQVQTRVTLPMRLDPADVEEVSLREPAGTVLLAGSPAVPGAK